MENQFKTNFVELLIPDKEKLFSTKNNEPYCYRNT